MRRAIIGMLVWLALGTVATAAHGQGDSNELSGVLRVTDKEAWIEGDERVRLIGVPPQRAVAIEPLLAESAEALQHLDGKRVRATGQLQGSVLWNAWVEVESGEEPPAPLVVTDAGPPFDEVIGDLRVTESQATIDGRIRLIGVSPQRAVAIKPLLLETAEIVRPLDGKRVRATGRLRGDILWDAVVGEAPEEEVEDELEEETEEGAQEIEMGVEPEQR